MLFILLNTPHITKSNTSTLPFTSLDALPEIITISSAYQYRLLFQCIDSLSLHPLNLPDLGGYNDNSPVLSHHAPGTKLTDVVFGNDIDSVDVAIRAALVKFFTSPSVNGDFSQHCRILRLYPRPLVAFQRDAFIKSRQESSDFICALAETQVSLFFIFGCFCCLLLCYFSRHLFPVKNLQSTYLGFPKDSAFPKTVHKCTVERVV